MDKGEGAKTADNFKNALDGLMSDFESGVFNRADDGKELGDIIAPTPPGELDSVDLMKMDTNLRKDANEVVDALYKMYFRAGLLNKFDYILKRKQQLDSMNLANMLFQIQTVKLSIMSAIQMVQFSQDPDPRLWKSIADLQTVFADLTKNLANYVIYLENNYRIQKEELEEGDVNSPAQIRAKPEIAAIAEKSGSIEELEEELEEELDDVTIEEVKVVDKTTTSESKVIKSKGSNLNLVANAKNLVDEIIDNNDYELTKPMKSMPLTSPHHKEELAASKGIDLSAIEEDSDYDELNDIIV